MKLLRLVALAITVSAWCAVSAFAGDCGSQSGCTAHTTAAAANAKGTCPAGATCPKGSAQCASGTTAAAAHASGCCGAKATAAGSRCDMHAGDHKMACVVCTDETTCDADLHGVGAHAQVVALRNGAMIVYTADRAENVHTLQATVARYQEHIMGALAAGSDASLCGECKALRGAMASGKFTREVVNDKNGCRVLLTSTDASVVRKIHGMTGTASAAAAAARTKS